MKNLIITPLFGTSHDVYFSKISKEMGLEELKLFSGKTRIQNHNLLINLKSFLYFIYIFPKLILKKILFKDIRDTYVGKVNIGFSVNEQCVSRSTTGKAEILPILKTSLKAILIYFELKKLFNKKLIKYVIGGDEKYIYHSIACQLAHLYGIKSRNIRGTINIVTFKYDFENLTTDYSDIFNKNNFVKLTKSNLELSEKTLNKQIHGNFEKLHHMKTFKSRRKIGNLEGYIVIYLHDFFDAPGFIGGNIFPDHYSWIIFTLKTLQKYKIRIAIKEHPNARPENKNIIQKLKKDWKNILFLTKDISTYQLYKSDILGIVTVYGSIQFEASYLNIPVVSASKNSAVNVVNSSLSKKDYKNQLLKLAFKKNLFIPSKKTILEHFFLHCQYFNYSIKLKNSNNYCFDDITRKIWEKLYSKEFPENVIDRRKVFKYSKKYKEYLYKVLKNKNLVKDLNL